MTSLTDLIERVEGATGPDREIGVTVLASLLAPTPVTISKSPFNGAWCAYEIDWKGKERLWQTPMPFRQMGCVTESLDAALALCERVLPGADWHLQTLPDGRAGFTAFIIQLDQIAVAVAPTPAISLILAMLKALQAKEAGE
jgi:hypothetical protein